MRKYLALGFSALLAACMAPPAEQQAWDAARASNTVNSYRDYLAEYPDGFYAEQAIARLETVLSPAEIAELGLASATASGRSAPVY